MNKNYKEDFPLFLKHQKSGKDLIYFDNAATTQKPKQVIEAIVNYYENYAANPHRGAYALSSDATDAYENARKTTARFIGADSEEIIFTSGTTQSINLLASSLCQGHLGADDEILISIAEHHSNLLPWQRVAELTGARLRYMYLDEFGRIPKEEWEKKITTRTKIVSIIHVSNVLGSMNPIDEIVKAAHAAGAQVLLDAAQSVPHMKIDVKKLDVDYLAFSGHKMLGPAGIGVLYGKYNLLKKLNPVNIGGGIVEEVTEMTVRYKDPPWKFEAGTPNVEGAVGLKAAIEYIETIGIDKINEIETELTDYALNEMKKIPELIVYGDLNSSNRAGIISFHVKDVHPHDTASILDADGVAIRAGHHCAQPLMVYLGVYSTCRMSLYFYNTKEEIDIAMNSLKKVRGVLGYGD